MEGRQHNLKLIVRVEAVSGEVNMEVTNRSYPCSAMELWEAIQVMLQLGLEAEHRLGADLPDKWVRSVLTVEDASAKAAPARSGKVSKVTTGSEL